MQFERDSNMYRAQGHGIDTLLNKMEKIEESVSDPDRVNSMGQSDMLFMSRELRNIREELKTLSDHDMLSEQDKEDELNKKANDQLLSSLQRKNIFKLSVEDVYTNFISTWHKIFLEMTSLDLSVLTKSDTDWWDKMIQVFRLLFEIFITSDRMIYVGIGLVILSFFWYFIFASG
jgi:hypothetical protein